MINEIIQFIDYLEDKSPDVFSENIILKEGLYVFLEKVGDELVIKDENILKVDKDTERNQLYDKFIQKYTVTEMIRNKSLNSTEKIFIEVGSPFAISISGKGHKSGRVKKAQAADAYFKAIQKFLNNDNKQYLIWHASFKSFVRNKMFDYLDSIEEAQKPKDTYMFYFFMKEPTIDAYNEFYNQYIASKVFLYDLKKNETHGISNDLNVGNINNKPFMRHKTASFDTNYKVDELTSKRLYQFFRLQQKNKILPNPMPLFVDKEEIILSEKAVKFFNSKKDKKYGHKEIIEHLLSEHKNDLHNYYLIFFHNRLKGSRIIDMDFVPVFKYKTDDMPKIAAVFKMTSKKEGELLREFSIKNIFHFQTVILNKIFNNQLIGNEGAWIKYFDDLKPNPKFDITDVIVDLFYKYRKAFYDFVYKSKRQAITFPMFDDMMKTLILDDLRHDKFVEQFKSHTKEKGIKEKLNIWFSLYNYFEKSKKSENMVTKIENHRNMIVEIAEGKRNINDDEEFAFVAGQVIFYLLSKSKSADKSYSRLEPFLQKSKYVEFRKALSLTFNTYKHENFSTRFKNPFANIMDYDINTDIKELIPIMLAGFFSDCALFATSKDKKETK